MRGNAERHMAGDGHGASSRSRRREGADTERVEEIGDEPGERLGEARAHAGCLAGSLEDDPAPYIRESQRHQQRQQDERGAAHGSAGRVARASRTSCSTQARSSRASQVPDLVLLDIWMPDTDGITLLREWSVTDGYDCPVVMMSGHGTVETAVGGAGDQRLADGVSHGGGRGRARR